MGQNVYPLISLVPNKIEYIKKIILDIKTTEKVRTWGAIILIDDFQQHDVERAISFCESMINNFPLAENKEWFLIIKETLIKDQYIDFHG